MPATLGGATQTDSDELQAELSTHARVAKTFGFPVRVRSRLPIQMLAPNSRIACPPHVSALPRLPAQLLLFPSLQGASSENL